MPEKRKEETRQAEKSENACLRSEKKKLGKRKGRKIPAREAGMMYRQEKEKKN